MASTKVPTAKFKIYRGTWFGRKGQQAHTSNSRTARRLIVQRWDDTGMAELRDVSGDATALPSTLVVHRVIDLGLHDCIEHAVATADTLR